MSFLPFSGRVGAWLLCLALVLGPVGPGGAWHVAHLDVVDSLEAPTSVADPDGRTDTSEHAGLWCLVCQAIHGVRAVLPAVVTVAIAAPSSAGDPPEAARPQARDASDTSPSRAPPLS